MHAATTMQAAAAVETMRSGISEIRISSPFDSEARIAPEVEDVGQHPERFEHDCGHPAPVVGEDHNSDRLDDELDELTRPESSQTLGYVVVLKQSFLLKRQVLTSASAETNSRLILSKFSYILQ